MSANLPTLARKLKRSARLALTTRDLGSCLTIGSGSDVGAARFEVRERSDGSISVGRDCLIQGSLVVERQGASISVGDRSFIGARTLIGSAAGIRIGADVLVSFDVCIMDHDSHAVELAQRRSDLADTLAGRPKDWTDISRGPVQLGDGCWVGARATILKGVVVGEGSIVGAGSVVTRSVAPGVVVAGNPAREIGMVPSAFDRIAL